jgi:hypothetical protein
MTKQSVTPNNLPEDSKSQPEQQNFEVTGDVLVDESQGMVQMTETNTQEINAEQVQMRQSGAGKIVAQSLSMVESGAGMLKAGSANVEGGGIGFIQAQDISLTNSNVSFVLTQVARMEETRSVITVARQVDDSSIQSILFVGGKVNGTVHTSIDTPRAAVFGLSAGLGLGIVFFFFKFIFGKKRL